MEPHRRCLFASSWLHRIYWNSSLSNQSAAGSQTPSSIISREATSPRLASCHGLLILACRMERWWQQPMSCATVRGLAIAVSVLAHSCSYWQGDGGAADYGCWSKGRYGLVLGVGREPGASALRLSRVSGPDAFPVHVHAYVL